MHHVLRRVAKLIGQDRPRGGAWNGRGPFQAASRRTRTRTLGYGEISITTADERGRSNVLRCALHANPVSRNIGPRIATTGRPRPERRVRITCKRDSDRAGQGLPVGQQTANPAPRRAAAFAGMQGAFRAARGSCCWNPVATSGPPPRSRYGSTGKGIVARVLFRR